MCRMASIKKGVCMSAILICRADMRRLSEKADKHHPGLLMLLLCTRSTSQGWQISLLRAQMYTQVPVGGSSHACPHIKHITHTHTRAHAAHTCLTSGSLFTGMWPFVFRLSLMCATTFCSVWLKISLFT